MSSEAQTVQAQQSSAASQKSNLLPFIICTLAAFFYFYEFFLRVMPSAVTQELMHDFGTRAAGLGILSSMFYWGYTPMQVPAGLLLDRFGPRRILSISILLCALSTFIFSITSNLVIASASRFIIGMGSSFAYLGALILAARWYPPKHFAFTAGLVQVLGCIGAIVGQAPVAAAAQHMGWRSAMTAAGFICVALSLLFWLIIRDYPPGHPHNHSKPEFSLIEQLTVVCSNRQAWLIALHAFTTWAPVTIIGDLWGASFLSSEYGYTSIQATSLTTMLWMGVAVCGPMLGWWSASTRSRKKPLILGSILGIISSIAIIYCHLSWPLMLLSLFTFGAAASSQAVTFGLIHDHMPSHVAGTAVGFNNMAVIFGGITVQPLVSFLLDQRLPGSTAYTAGDYQAVFIVIPLIFLLGLFVSSFALKETHCQHQYEP